MFWDQRFLEWLLWDPQSIRFSILQILGELHISVCHQPLSSKLSVTVLEARNLPKISSLNIGGTQVFFFKFWRRILNLVEGTGIEGWVVDKYMSGRKVAVNVLYNVPRSCVWSPQMREVTLFWFIILIYYCKLEYWKQIWYSKQFLQVTSRKRDTHPQILIKPQVPESSLTSERRGV